MNIINKLLLVKMFISGIKYFYIHRFKNNEAREENDT
jgi:hypothetical protein